MPRHIIRFETNTPVTVALEFPDGINVLGRSGPQVRFSLTENRLMYCDNVLAIAIRQLNVVPGQPFTITKRFEPGEPIWWDVQKVKTPRLAVEKSEPPVTSKTPPPTESSPVSAPATGILSEGPVRKTSQVSPVPIPDPPPLYRGMQLTKTPPSKPSYEEAFRECLRIVTHGLGDAREQWSDAAKQAMVSTLLIQLGRENRLGEFRPAASKVA